MGKDARPVGWIRAAREGGFFEGRPRQRGLDHCAEGGKIVKPLRDLGSGGDRGAPGTWRVVYVTEVAAVGSARFPEEIQTGVHTPKTEPGASRAIEGGIAAMQNENPIEGSGNVFRDFGDPEADLKQAKAVPRDPGSSPCWTSAVSACGRRRA